MKRLGFAYDWSREVTTCLPDYYRWNQWFFIKFYERGLAYRKKSRVNWCPKCATVLANEQVVEGHCWRHEDTIVEQRELEQWFLRITEYAENCCGTSTSSKDGRKKCHHAAQLDRTQRRHAGRLQARRHGGPAGSTIRVFTTRVDTIYGATSVQLAPEHPLVADLSATNPALRAQVDQLIAEQRKAKEVGDIGAIEKHGVNTGRFAINPYNGEKVPIWVANYILMDYGTGAIMSVPAHDERDHEFANKYGIDIRQVIAPKNASYRCGRKLPFTTQDGVLINSGPFTGLSLPGSHQEDGCSCRGEGFRQSHRDIPFERLGNLAAAILGNADSDDLLREGRHSSGP